MAGNSISTERITGTKIWNLGKAVLRLAEKCRMFWKPMAVTAGGRSSDPN